MYSLNLEEILNEDKIKNPYKTIVRIKWRIRGSNPSPLDCQSNALAR